jgi:hypothetical protein
MLSSCPNSGATDSHTTRTTTRGSPQFHLNAAAIASAVGAWRRRRGSDRLGGCVRVSCHAVNMSTRTHEFNREKGQCPKPGRLSSRFDCLSARFSFSDLLGFFTFCFFGDLSPTVCSLLSVRRDPRSSVPRCVPQRFYQPLVMFDTKGRSVSAKSAGRDRPPAETVPEGSTVGWIVKDHGSRLFGGWRTVTSGPPPL